jgi:hypothetical protein
MRTYTHTHTPTHPHPRTRTRAPTRAYAHTPAPTRTHAHPCMPVRLRMHTRAHAHACTHACAYTRTRSRTMHTHHTHAPCMRDKPTRSRIPLKRIRSAYNAFFACSAWQCSTTRRKRLKTALIAPHHAQTCQCHAALHNKRQTPDMPGIV